MNNDLTTFGPVPPELVIVLTPEQQKAILRSNLPGPIDSTKVLVIKNKNRNEPYEVIYYRDESQSVIQYSASEEELLSAINTSYIESKDFIVLAIILALGICIWWSR